jgi:signal transduction histidine kinase
VTILDKVLATGEPFLGRAIPFVASRAAHEAPTEAYLDFVYQPIFDDAGNASGVFVQGHEVTEQHVARQALVDADRQKDRFIATLAHELRNPLGPVRNAAALLRMPELSTERIERATGIISRQVGHMARLLDDLLDVARLRNGQLILKIEDINPDDVIQLAIEAASPAIEEKQHSFSHEKFGPDVVLRVDPARLAQVITNLLTNSAKYTRARGQLRLTSFTRDGEWIVSVSDNGVGLGAEALDRVFDMFAQEQSASDLPQTGLGIGLAISKSLIELHGGMLIAESDGINRGSTFTVRIPPESVRILMTS